MKCILHLLQHLVNGSPEWLFSATARDILDNNLLDQGDNYLLVGLLGASTVKPTSSIEGEVWRTIFGEDYWLHPEAVTDASYRAIDDLARGKAGFGQVG